MVNRNLLRQFDVTDDDILSNIDDIFNQEIASLDPPAKSRTTKPTRSSPARSLDIRGDDVVIDVGYKSEGVITLDEWNDEGADTVAPPKAGDTVQVLLETVEDEDGAIVLSYRKAKRQKEWEGDPRQAQGRRRRLRPASPARSRAACSSTSASTSSCRASQVDIRRPPDIGDYIGQTIECMILKIDEAPPQHRRQPPQADRGPARRIQKEKLLAEIEPGQIRKGVVKNIAEFGAFVDLGGIDGLLHITDMGWDRVTNPHEVVQIDQELEVYILNVDKEKEKIALGLKHKTPSPWQNVEAKYPVGSRHTRRGRQRHDLRGVRQARAGHRGAGPHLRDVVDQAHQPPERAGADRRQDRGAGPEHQQGQAGNLAGHEAVPAEPVGQGGREVPAGHASSPAWSAT